MLTRAKRPSKAQVYFQKLDEARCQGRWSDLAELARKVEKHAPDRKCLALVARSEAQVANYSHNPDASSSIAKLTQPLTEASVAASNPEDAFQAQVCVAWIHWMLNESKAAIDSLPIDLAAITARLASGDMMQWTQVCIIKSAYIKGFSQEACTNPSTAQKTYSGVLPYLQSFEKLSATNAQLHLWTERLLTRMCMLLMRNRLHGGSLTQALHIFRLWDALWNPEPSYISSYKSLAKVDTEYTRRDVWRFCYRFLSLVVQKGLIFFQDASFLTDATELDEWQLAENRLNLRSMLKRVEVTCESFLLQETTFPKASENNEEVDSWADEVVANWRVMCGPSWHDAELGEGGKAALSRNVLDILYRAASKTFHSIRILRHLFIVHASLAEFDLAFKAFDSYIDIVKRARERSDRSGEIDNGVDDQNTVVRTAAEAVRLLCRYGTFKEAERAYELGNMINRWLQHRAPPVQGEKSAQDSQPATEALLTPETLGIAYRAIGISRAHWARTTYDESVRSSLQPEAITFLRKTLEYEKESSSLETLYALGLVLAESRDIAGAIKTVKRGLTPDVPSADSSLHTDGIAKTNSTLPNTYHARQRKQVALWHLLALLLTSRSDFTMAAKACEAAFDQFGDIINLLGSPDQQLFQSEHLNEKSISAEPNGLVDRMEPAEKTKLLQVKLTQMSLTEVVEGVSAAVDTSSELLALYARLFGDPKAVQVRHPPPTAVPPKTGMTLKGSIFSRGHSVRNTISTEKDMAVTASVTSSGRPSTNITANTGAPAIHVTDDANRNEKQTSPRSDRPFTAPSQGGRMKLQKRSTGSLSRKPSEAAREAGQPRRSRSARHTPTDRLSISERRSMSSRASSESVHMPLLPISQHATLPPLIGELPQPSKQNQRLSFPIATMTETTPEPKFPNLQERRHKISLLIDVWLFIAGLYRRAEYYDDAKGAADEAQLLVESLESEVAQVDASWRALGDKGWGDGKSIEELWADIWVERAELALVDRQPHRALSNFEKALQHLPNHPTAVVGLSTILLDIYAEKVPAEEGLSPSLSLPTLTNSTSRPDGEGKPKSAKLRQKEDLTPQQLNRLAARDRAYGMLSSLTKLGRGWDDAEAWFTLAKAYEEGGQEAKARECLWWVVELEDGRPVRRWDSVGGAGGVL